MLMPKHLLDSADVYASIQQMGGHCSPNIMWAKQGNPCLLSPFPKNLSQ